MRINVVGSSGSGKTTMGRKLAQALQVPFIEMDALFWGPEWYFPPDEEFFLRLSEALKGNNWVLDGNYSRTRPIKWQRVQAVVWVDYSFARTLFQSFTRTLSRVISQNELWPGTGNKESLQMLFSSDSILLYAITSYGRKRTRIKAAAADPDYAHIKFHHLRSPAQARKFMKQVHNSPDLLIDDLPRYPPENGPGE